MKKITRKGISILLTLVLCLLPMASLAQGNMLGERTTQALEAGKSLQITFSLQLGAMAMEDLGDEEAKMVAQVLDITQLRLRAALTPDGMPVVNMALALSGTEVVHATLRAQEEGLAVDTSLLLDKTLYLPYEWLAEILASEGLDLSPILEGEDLDLSQLAALTGAELPDTQLDEEQLEELLGMLEPYAAVFMTWMQNTPSLVAQEAQNYPATATRNQAAQRLTVRLEAEQMLDLLTQLADAFSQDTALLNLLLTVADQEEMIGMFTPEQLREELMGMIGSIETTDGAAVADVYTDAADELVAITYVYTPMFDDFTGALNFQYEHVGDETKGTHAVRVYGPIEDVAFTLDADVRHDFTNPLAKQGGMSLRIFDGEETAISLLADYLAAFSDTRESFDASLILRYEMVPGARAGFAALLPAAPIDAAEEVRLDLHSAVEALAGDDFTSEVTLSASLLNEQVATVRFAFSSVDYTPTDISRNTIVDFSTLDNYDASALEAELEQSLGLAVMGALPLLPAELRDAVMSLMME